MNELSDIASEGRSSAGNSAVVIKPTALSPSDPHTGLEVAPKEVKGMDKSDESILEEVNAFARRGGVLKYCCKGSRLTRRASHWK